MLCGNLNVSASDLDGIIVTHEHTDHIQSVGSLSKKFNLPVFATKKTFDAMPKQCEKITDVNRKNISTSEHFSIGDIEISPFSIPHDAADPCGYTILSDSKKISVATDIRSYDK
jgi:phosphoribosyl 1,2-cyclic phosphodiesterase